MADKTNPPIPATKDHDGTAKKARPLGVDAKKVFVIHGRNELARRGLFEFLRAIGLDPIEFHQAIGMTGKGSPYIGEILDAAFGAAQAVVVLQTPDDVAYLHDSLSYPGDPDCKPDMQPRPNVLFEAGMAIGRDENRTIIVELGKVRGFSDVHGRHVVRLDGSLPRRQDLANRLRTAGCTVSTDGTDWHTAGNLEPPPPPGGGLPLGRRLPSAENAGLPQLRATYHGRSGNSLSPIRLTNHGPGDIYELTVTPASDVPAGMLRQSLTMPVPKLPEGKSVEVLEMMPMSFGDRDLKFFNLEIKARTADGAEINQTEFVSVD